MWFSTVHSNPVTFSVNGRLHKTLLSASLLRVNVNKRFNWYERIDHRFTTFSSVTFTFRFVCAATVVIKSRT